MRYRDDLAFPMPEYERRLAELRQHMAEQDIDALIVTTPENICYLTGFETLGYFRFIAIIVPIEGEIVAVPRQLEDSGFVEFTYVEIRRPYADVQDPIDHLSATLTEFGWHDKRIGIERGCWFFTALQQEQLIALCSDATFIDGTGLVEAGRVIKSAYEIDLMRRAARTTEAGLQAGIDAIEFGATENDIAAAMQYAMIKAGSQWSAIAPFVASGYRGAVGHATWMGRTITPDEFIMLELAGSIRRYHTALMRTIYVGEPSLEVLKAVGVVQEAIQAMMGAIKPGMLACDADAIGREIIAASSFGGTQASRSAYSIGIAFSPDWGEGHIISMQPDDKQILQENMTFHLLPWVQVPDEGGISFSETIRITADGCERLTNFQSDLIVK